MRSWRGSVRPVPEYIAMLCASLMASAAMADTAFVTCQTGDAVGVVDLDTGKGRAVWSMPGKPAGIARGDKGDLYVVAPEAKLVRHLSQSDGSVLRKTQLDGGPTGIAFDERRGRLFVSDWYNARLWVLDSATLQTVVELPTGTSPAGIDVSPDGRFVASADKDANQVSVFDAETLEVRYRIDVGTRPFGLRFAPDGRLFVGNVGSNDLSVVDAENGEVIATVPVGERPYGVAFARGRAFVTNQYENTVSVIDLTSLDTVGTLDVGDYPEGIDTTRDGALIVLVNWFDNTLMSIDPHALSVIHEIDTCDGPRAFGRFLD